MRRAALLPLVAVTACLATLAGCHRAASRPSPFALADSLHAAGRFTEALGRYRVVRDSLIAAHDTAHLWHAHLWYAELLLHAGHNDSGAVVLDQAQALTGSDPDRQAWVDAVRAMLLGQLGQLDSAAAVGGRALTTARRVGDHAVAMAALREMETAHSQQGRYREAMAEGEEVVALARRYHDSPQVLAGWLNNLGIEYASAGRLGDAERVYDEGLALARHLPSPQRASVLHSNLSYVRATSGDLAGALALILASLREAEATADTSNMVYALHTAAEYHLQAGNPADARVELERARPMLSHVRAYDRAITLVDLGALDLAESRPESAAAEYAAAAALADTAGFGRQREDATVGLARVALVRGATANAVRLARGAVATADSLEDPDARFEALESLATALEADGHLGEAGGTRLAAIDLLESWRGRLALGDLRSGVAAPRVAAYEGAIRLLLRDGHAEDAFDVAERAKARLLLELIAEQRIGRSLASREEELRERLRERFAEWADGDKERRPVLDREIDEAIGELTTLEGRERQGGAGAPARYPTPAALPELRRGLLRPGRALLAFFWGDSAVYGWWVTDRTIRAARLGAADSLGPMVELLRAVLATPAAPTLWAAPARTAFRRLIAPLAPTPADEVLVVADGPLTFLPIEALLPAEGERPWGADHRVVYGPSASVLLALSQAHAADTARREVLAVGDPEGDRSLPYAAEEARDVYGLFDARRSDLLIGGRATLGRWRALDPGRYRYLHFAAHTMLERDPDRAELRLADGRLAPADIGRLRLQARLVALSACETARGRRVRGEGVIGLPYAFLAAGARDVLMSLWRVSDRSAAEFMEAFYRELRAGASAEEALRRVREAALRQPGRHPAEWASFVLFGAPEVAVETSP